MDKVLQVLRGYSFIAMGTMGRSASEQSTKAVRPFNNIQQITAVRGNLAQSAGSGDVAFVHTDVWDDFSFTCELTSQTDNNVIGHSGIYWCYSRINPNDDWPESEPNETDESIAVSVFRRSGDIRFEARGVGETSPSETSEVASAITPGDSVRLRLVRRGAVFRAYYLPDGGSWTLLYAATPAARRPGHVGLFASGATAGRDVTAEFTHVDHVYSAEEISTVPNPPQELPLEEGDRVIATGLQLVRGTTSQHRYVEGRIGLEPYVGGDGVAEKEDGGTFSVVESIDGRIVPVTLRRRYRGSRFDGQAKRWLAHKLGQI